MTFRARLRAAHSYSAGAGSHPRHARAKSERSWRGTPLKAWIQWPAGFTAMRGFSLDMMIYIHGCGPPMPDRVFCQGCATAPPLVFWCAVRTCQGVAKICSPVSFDVQFEHASGVPLNPAPCRLMRSSNMPRRGHRTPPLVFYFVIWTCQRGAKIWCAVRACQWNKRMPARIIWSCELLLRHWLASNRSRTGYCEPQWRWFLKSRRAQRYAVHVRISMYEHRRICDPTNVSCTWISEGNSEFHAFVHVWASFACDHGAIDHAHVARISQILFRSEHQMLVHKQKLRMLGLEYRYFLHVHKLQLCRSWVVFV